MLEYISFLSFNFCKFFEQHILPENIHSLETNKNELKEKFVDLSTIIYSLLSNAKEIELNRICNENVACNSLQNDIRTCKENYMKYKSMNNYGNNEVIKNNKSNKSNNCKLSTFNNINGSYLPKNLQINQEDENDFFLTLTDENKKNGFNSEQDSITAINDESQNLFIGKKRKISTPNNISYSINTRNSNLNTIKTISQDQHPFNNERLYNNNSNFDNNCNFKNQENNYTSKLRKNNFHNPYNIEKINNKFNTSNQYKYFNSSSSKQNLNKMYGVYDLADNLRLIEEIIRNFNHLDIKDLITKKHNYYGFMIISASGKISNFYKFIYYNLIFSKS